MSIESQELLYDAYLANKQSHAKDRERIAHLEKELTEVEREAVEMRQQIAKLTQRVYGLECRDHARTGA